MIEPHRRPRGRPKGSGKDDSKLLADVADLLLVENIKPSTAMRRVIGKRVQEKLIAQHDVAATLRRLQEKWFTLHRRQ